MPLQNIDISQYNKLRNGILRPCYCPELVRAEMGRQQLVYYYVPGIQLSTSSELGSSGRRKDNDRCLNDGPSPCSCGRTWLCRVGGFRGPPDWLDGCLVVCSSERYNEVDPNWALVRELFAVISFRLSKNDDYRTNIILEWNGGQVEYSNGWSVVPWEEDARQQVVSLWIGELLVLFY